MFGKSITRPRVLMTAEWFMVNITFIIIITIIKSKYTTLLETNLSCISIQIQLTLVYHIFKLYLTLLGFLLFFDLSSRDRSRLPRAGPWDTGHKWEHISAHRDIHTQACMVRVWWGICPFTFGYELLPPKNSPINFAKTSTGFIFFPRTLYSRCKLYNFQS